MAPGCTHAEDYGPGLRPNQLAFLEQVVHYIGRIMLQQPFAMPAASLLLC